MSRSEKQRGGTYGARSFVRSFVLFAACGALSCAGEGRDVSAVRANLDAVVNASQSSRVNLLEPQTNYGASEWIRVSGGPEFGGHVDVGLVDFAEAETPEPDALRRAVLRLHYQNCSGERVEVRRLPVRWDEARVNHDCADDLTVPLGAPGCGEGVEWPIDGPEGPFNTLPLVAEAICPAGTGELAIDVTADVLSWGTGERWGWAIGSERGAFRFASDDHLTLAPSLTMTTETDWVPEEPVAPQLDHTAITNVRDAYRFLYDPAAVSGDPQNVQLGVFPGTIDADRAAHLRGQVLRDDGSPLGGVSITVRGHPEVGRTRSRAGGVFDLVLNGGGPVTLIYRHPDHLEVHRTVYAGWNDDLAVADVVMTPNPTRCSPYVSGAAGGMLTGTEVILSGAWSADGQNGWSTEDGRGARAFGLYIPPQVAPINEGGAVGGYRICMTEYTRDVVGTDRENAMPADIATNTAYTFAAEGQIVQVADASDSTGQVLARAEFSDDAYLYVRTSDWHGGGEDLRFVAGTVIPMGNFDRDLSAWVPARDGVAIDVLCSNGLFVAMLPATAGELTVHEQVAICGSSLVDSDGQTWTHLWRVPVRHFSPVDLNVCTITEDIPPPGSGGPEESNGGHGDESEHCEPGSIIHCEGRSVAETIPLAGVGASLVYQSSHHLGRQDLRELRVRPVRQPVSIPSLGATSRVFVSGRQIAEFAFSNADLAAGVSRSVTWDGLDGFREASERACLCRGGDPLRRPDSLLRAGRRPHRKRGRPVWDRAARVHMRRRSR
jgi:hypothetical protein